ncbi:MAG: hypothetical protein Q8L79_03180 [Methylobacter sp.]|uniref:hypothetical protein n=1 Tax=Methylobacter sp. TaxID=2051955 RepID=UPI0027306F0A|nr:hypothetical protein [Methylobacter sp.]MDP1664104.1 hypothetical protein [Methylobacter sp.]
MAKPTKAQWDEVKLKLSRPYGSAYFKCDDYLIHAEVRQNKMTLKIQVYVNGWIKGEWWWTGKERDLGTMPDIPRRFHCLTRKGKSAKEIGLNHKIFGKKVCKDKGINDKFCMAYPIFNTAGGFVAHLKKHNPAIEVLDFLTYQKARDALPIDTDEIASAAALGEEHA